ncbi:MAG: FRG domain-containing protein [Terriglobales bacterium]
MSAKVARSLGEYLSMVGVVRKRWKVPKHHELWFRAEDVSHRQTHLQPGIYRQRGSGLRKSFDKLLEIENDLYEEFGRCATQLSAPDVKSIDDEWDSYFLMQHHGAPTRLLDWSDGALIALHFAVRDKSRPPKSGSIIYVLDPYWLNKLLRNHPDRKNAAERWRKYWEKHPNNLDEDEWERLYLPPEGDEAKDPLLKTPETPMLWDSPHVTRRVAAQRSRFMIFGTDPSWVVRMQKEEDSRLVSITIPRGSINRIRQELKDAGITESVVYPDLDGLGRELRQVWQARS